MAPPNDEEPFTIGWIGSPDTVRYVKPIADALRTVCEERDAELVLVGSGREDFPVEQSRMIEWSEETEVDSICEFDVGIMPLQDGPWERGKCGLKLIQYMGCAKPVVASPVGMNGSIVSEGETGYFASDHDQWVDRLKHLADKPDLARQLGKNGYKRVKQNYCLSVTVPELIKLIRNVVL
jgi:glycosyltransferase involved in cell wall biosynthesis